MRRFILKAILRLRLITDRRRGRPRSFGRARQISIVSRLRRLLVAVGRHMAPLTGNGAHWPRGAEWDAALVTTGLQIVSDQLAPQRKLPAGERPVAELFADLPVAVLHARQSSAVGRASRRRIAEVPAAE